MKVNDLVVGKVYKYEDKVYEYGSWTTKLELVEYAGTTPFKSYRFNSFPVSAVGHNYTGHLTKEAVEQDIFELDPIYFPMLPELIPAEEATKHTCVFKEYVGLTQVFKYCTICDKKQVD